MLSGAVIRTQQPALRKTHIIRVHIEAAAVGGRARGESNHTPRIPAKLLLMLSQGAAHTQQHRAVSRSTVFSLQWIVCSSEDHDKSVLSLSVQCTCCVAACC